MTALAFPVSSLDHSLGPAEAPLFLVEYGDYECPYYADAEEVVSRLRKDFGQRLRTVFRHFPLANIHANALAASLAAEAAARHGLFWEMHKALFENQWHLGNDTILEIADELGLGSGKLLSEISAPAVQEHVLRDIFGGERSGVKSTPTFFVGGQRYEGMPTYATLREELERHERRRAA